MPNTLPERVNELLAWIERQSDGMPFIQKLPAKLRNVDVLTVADSWGLIECGGRRYLTYEYDRGGRKLVTADGYSFTGPGHKPMREVFAEDEQLRRENPELGMRVRLTNPGRSALSEYRLVVEATAADLEAGLSGGVPWRSLLKPGHVVGSLAAWCAQYGLPVWMSGDHAGAGRFVERYLYQCARAVALEHDAASAFLGISAGEPFELPLSA